MLFICGMRTPAVLIVPLPQTALSERQRGPTERGRISCPCLDRHVGEVFDDEARRRLDGDARRLQGDDRRREAWEIVPAGSGAAA